MGVVLLLFKYNTCQRVGKQFNIPPLAAVEVLDLCLYSIGIDQMENMAAIRIGDRAAFHRRTVIGIAKESGDILIQAALVYFCTGLR